MPLAGELIWFLCRFETREPIRVALPPDATPAERSLLLRALEAWEGAGLGVRFAEAPPAQAEIAIAFEPDDSRYAAITEAECRVERAAQAGAAGERLPARLVRARVGLRRAQLDWRGHRAPLDAAQQLGAALHELGHALGFQGHARAGDTVMLRNLEAVRDIGRSVRDGAALRDAALAALYRVASGTVVERAALPASRSGPVDRLAALAARRGDGSLLVRAGDFTQRIAFAEADAEPLRVFLRDVRAALGDPARLELAADPQLLGLREQEP